MGIEIREVGAEAFDRWTHVPISFRVESVLTVSELDGGLGGLSLVEEKLDKPYIKDYDTFEDELPSQWLRFDISEWGFFQAFDGDEVVGCAAVALRSPKIRLLGGRDDLGHLWDIRVHPEYRRSGIGATLFRRSAEFAGSKGCIQFRIETQNTNVVACRFYQNQGCYLGSIRRDAYHNEPAIAHEVMLVWYLDL